jgi:uncharacterized protein YjdB
MRGTFRHVAAAVSIIGIAACSDNSTLESTSPPGEEKLSVVLSVHTDTIPESSSTLITARVTNQTGALKLVPVDWRTSDASVASVSAGTITGVTPGSAMIIASAGGGADSALIVVTRREYLLDVQPSAAVVALGDTIYFKATVRSNSGEVVSVNNLTWSSSDTAAARFVNGGSLVTRGEGELLVSAETMYGRGTGSVKVFRTPVSSVTISPTTANVYVGAKVALAVTLRDQQGRLVEGGVTFGSSDYSKATVNQDGVVTGVASGTVIITATSGSKTGSATINVLGTPAASVSLVVPSDTIPVGVEIQATATPLDASGNPLTDRTIAYQSANPSVATVNSTGVVKGISGGSTTISAIVDGKFASKRVSVGGRKATSLTMSPQSASVSVGKQSQLTAKVLDQAGIEMTGQTISWTSGSQTIASVSSGGLVSGLSAGSTTISASSNGLSASVVLTVVSAAVASVQISPSTVSLVMGSGGVTLTANALDADGNSLPGRVATWSSQNPTVASVNSSGVVSAIGAGSTTVTANIEGKSTSVTVNVGVAPAAPVASVTVTLGNPALSVGQETQGVAIVKDGQGNVLNRAVTWSSLDTAVAKVTSSGLVTAHAAGTVAILARSEGVSGSASLTVNSPSPAAVAVMLLDVPTEDLLLGQSIQSVITLKDAQGNTLYGRTITYSTDNSSIVTVSATGVITGVGVGSARVTASSGGVSVGETFRVTAPPQTLTSITITPSSTSLSVGQTAQATATGKDAQGTTVPGAYTWTTTNPAVATVSTAGVVSAVGPGSATINALASGVTGSMSVSVSSSPASVASVTVIVPTSLSVGSSAQASAVVKDASGNVLSGKAVAWTSATTSIASVSSTGVVTGLTSGTAQIRASADGVLGSATTTVSSTVTSVAAPELPRVVPASQDPYPGRSCSVTVAAGGNIGAALSAARGGSVVCLSAGATYGQVYLPARATGDTGWIVLRTATTLPAEGTRIRPSAAGQYATIATANSECALRTTPGTHGWFVAGVRITSVASMTYQVACLGDRGAEQDTPAEVPQRLVLSRVLVDGGSGQIQRCVSLNSGATAIVDSWLMNCHIKGFEGHGIGGWNGTGPFLIENNYIEAAGINLMFGGATPSIANLRASDITIRRNHVTKQLAWGPAGTGAGPWTEKNLLETKNAARVLIEGNVFENSWQDAQPTGSGIMIKSINDEGNCGWCQSSDVTIRRNFGTNIETPIVVSAAENYNDPSRPPPSVARIEISENVFDNIGAVAWGAKAIQLTGGHSTTGASDVAVERNVIAQGAGKMVAHMLLVSWPGMQRSLFRDNVWTHGAYTVLTGEGAFGVAALSIGAPDAAWSNMWLVKSPNHTEATPTMPAGTTVVSAESSVPLAAQLRASVAAAVAGVVIQP